jgi:hypothetical protein
LEGSGTTLATVQANRGASRRFGSRPSDRGNAPPPVNRPRDVLCLLDAARAITVKPALVSIVRRNSRTSGLPLCERFECLHGSRHRPRPVERNHEQARMVGEVNRSACEGQDAAIAIGSVLAQPRPRSRQLNASLL